MILILRLLITTYTNQYDATCSTGGSLLSSSINSRFNVGYSLHLYGAFPYSLASKQVDSEESFGGYNEAHTLRRRKQSVHNHWMCGKGNDRH